MPISLADRQKRNRLKMFLQVLPLLLIVAVSIFGIAQLKVVREFLSHASGEPANLIVDTQAILGPMPRPWRNFAQGGEGANWRMQPIASQVKALHPAYIRIDHIYDFYDIVHGSPGNLSFDFSKLDNVLDDIQATGATPYIALSYMPPAISSGDILSVPKNWSDWSLVVQKTIEHVSGTRHTANVYYEVWNEPDLYGNWKYYGSKNYLTLYENAVQGANNAQGVLPFKIGGPAITALYQSWFDAMAKDATQNGVRLDFFSWHRYTTDLDQYKKDMFDVQTWVRNYPQLDGTLEFHITEWGHNSNNDPGYDTNLGAAHTVAGAIEMIGVVDHAFAFEIQDGKDPNGQAHWGRWGLFTHADFGAQPKPRYFALKLLDQIGNQRLQILGQGTWVKAAAALNDAGNPQVVLSNFDTYNSNSESVPITFQNIQPGSYVVNEQFVGAPQKQATQNVATDAATLQIHVPMTANSVGLIELVRQ